MRTIISLKGTPMSTDREEAEKASKTLCSMLHLKVQYPDEN